MANKFKRRKGVKIKKEDPALSVIRENIPHWIHHTIEDDAVVGGIVYLPQCDCSVCGFTVNMEKEICPHCGTKMR